MSISNLNASNIIPLSATYGLNNTVNLESIYHQFKDGYRIIEQPIFDNISDIKYANSNMLAITQNQKFNDFVVKQLTVDTLDFVLFTGIQNIKNKNYITNYNNQLYCNSNVFGATEFFKIIRNIDGTYCIGQNNLYATVDISNGKWDLILSNKIDNDIYKQQCFNVYIAPTFDYIIIKTLFKMNKWIVNQWIQPIERYWSYSIVSNKVRANGMISDTNYIPYNEFIWNTTSNIDLMAMGFNNQIYLVTYYNEMMSKINNKNVEIKNYTTNVEQNYLINAAYKKDVVVNNQTAGQINVNIMNLKNIIAPDAVVEAFENA